MLWSKVNKEMDNNLVTKTRKRLPLADSPEVYSGRFIRTSVCRWTSSQQLQFAGSFHLCVISRSTETDTLILLTLASMISSSLALASCWAFSIWFGRSNVSPVVQSTVQTPAASSTTSHLKATELLTCTTLNRGRLRVNSYSTVIYIPWRYT